MACIGLFSLLYYVNTQENNNAFYGVWQLQQGQSTFNKIYIEGDAFQTVEFGKTEIDRKGRISLDTINKKIVFNSYPNAYIEKLYLQPSIKIDTTKREKIFDGNYELNNTTLKLKDGNAELVFKKIR